MRYPTSISHPRPTDQDPDGPGPDVVDDRRRTQSNRGNPPPDPPPVAAAHRRRCARWTIQSQSAHRASVRATVSHPPSSAHLLVSMAIISACSGRRSMSTPAADRYTPTARSRGALLSCQTAWTRHGTSRAHGPSPLCLSGPRCLVPTSTELPSGRRAGQVRMATPQTRCTDRPRPSAPTGHAKACAQTRRT